MESHCPWKEPLPSVAVSITSPHPVTPKRDSLGSVEMTENEGDGTGITRDTGQG